MSFLGFRNAVSIGVSQHVTMGGPNLLNKLSPSLLLNFAGAQTLDPRITFTRASTATFTDSNGLIQTAAIDAPRFDYNPTTLAPLGLLIEEQRTNLLTYSEQFDNAAWTKSQSSITANTIVAPDGTLTGDKLVENTATAVHSAAQSISGVSGTIYTITVYAKAAERTLVRLGSPSSIFGTGAVWQYDLTTGSVTTVTGTSGTSASAELVGNGWWRVRLTTIAATTTTTGSFTISLSTAGGGSYTGDGVSGIYIWGAQLEAGAFPTSYIPTVASQVTRAADAAVMTGTNFSSWYNQAEGTVYAEWNSVGSLSDSRIIYTLSDGTFSNVNYLTAATASAANQSVNPIRSSSTSQANIAVPGAYTNYAYRKTAGAYKVNDFALSGDGGAVVVDTSGLVPVGVDRLALGTSWIATSNFLGGHIKKIAYYPRRLANSELRAITS